MYKFKVFYLIILCLLLTSLFMEASNNLKAKKIVVVGGEDENCKADLSAVPTDELQKMKTYTYRVNENAGVPVPSGDPYQVQVGLRYAF